MIDQQINLYLGPDSENNNTWRAILREWTCDNFENYNVHEDHDRINLWMQSHVIEDLDSSLQFYLSSLPETAMFTTMEKFHVARIRLDVGSKLLSERTKKPNSSKNVIQHLLQWLEPSNIAVKSFADYLITSIHLAIEPMQRNTQVKQIFDLLI